MGRSAKGYINEYAHNKSYKAMFIINGNEKNTFIAKRPQTQGRKPKTETLIL